MYSYFNTLSTLTSKILFGFKDFHLVNDIIPLSIDNFVAKANWSVGIDLVPPTPIPDLGSNVVL
jgi:hypothetical protein